MVFKVTQKLYDHVIGASVQVQLWTGGYTRIHHQLKLPCSYTKKYTMLTFCLVTHHNPCSVSAYLYINPGFGSQVTGVVLRMDTKCL